MSSNDYHFIMKPIFSANHRWAMAKGEESLRLELARRRAATATDRTAITAPPQATAIPAVPLAVRAIMLASVAGGVWLLLRAGRRKS